jgi:hypothetical protein
LWGVPKELARFRWLPGAVEVSDATRPPLLRAAWREPRIRVAFPMTIPFLGALDGVVRRGRLTGTMRLAPSRVALEIAPRSPLAELRLESPRLTAIVACTCVRTGYVRRDRRRSDDCDSASVNLRRTKDQSSSSGVAGTARRTRVELHGPA